MKRTGRFAIVGRMFLLAVALGGCAREEAPPMPAATVGKESISKKREDLATQKQALEDKVRTGIPQFRLTLKKQAATVRKELADRGESPEVRAALDREHREIASLLLALDRHEIKCRNTLVLVGSSQRQLDRLVESTGLLGEEVEKLLEQATNVERSAATLIDVNLTRGGMQGGAIEAVEVEKKMLELVQEQEQTDLLAQARSKAEKNEFDQALDLLKRAMAVRPTPEVEEQTRKVLADKAHWEKLEKELREAKTQSDLLVQARSKAEKKEFDEAINLLKRAMAMRATPEVEEQTWKVMAAKAHWEKLDRDFREKEKAYTLAITRASAALSGLPDNKSALTQTQKATLAAARAAIQTALELKSGDIAALELQKRIESYFGPPKELILDLGSGVSLKCALIVAGKFTMGSPEREKDHKSNEGPQREVSISKPFYMGVYEVTQQQYEQVTGKNPSSFKGKTNPVEQVSWEDATEFCKALSPKTGKTVRLPTEAEWEYACRAGTTTRFSFGNDGADLHKYGNYCDRSCMEDGPWRDKEHNDGYDTTAPVGSFKPNAFGLYDMLGNACEWCSDWYVGSYALEKNQDPQGPDSGSTRVARGGCWGNDPALCRSAARDRGSPDYRSHHVGFRVVVDLR